MDKFSKLYLDSLENCEAKFDQKIIDEKLPIEQAEIRFSDRVGISFVMQPRVRKPRDRTNEPEG